MYLLQGSTADRNLLEKIYVGTLHGLTDTNFRSQLRTGDFTGDGRNDVLLYRQGLGTTYAGHRNIQVFQSNGTNTYDRASYWSEIDNEQGSYWGDINNRPMDLIQTGDFNGDGRLDLTSFQYQHYSIRTHVKGFLWYGVNQGLSSSRRSIYNQTSLNFNNFSQLTTGDLNGDGITDIFGTYHTGNGNSRIYVMSGSSDGLTSFENWNNNSLAKQRLTIRLPCALQQFSPSLVSATPSRTPSVPCRPVRP